MESTIVQKEIMMTERRLTMRDRTFALVQVKYQQFFACSLFVKSNVQFLILNKSPLDFK